MANPKLNLSNKSGSLPVHFEFKPQIMDSYCTVPFRSTRIIEIRVERLRHLFLYLFFRGKNNRGAKSFAANKLDEGLSEGVAAESG